jgi:hypothetical protein
MGKRMTCLVCTGVLEEYDTLLLQNQSRLLGNEEICTLDNIFEVRLAVSVEKTRHIPDAKGNLGLISFFGTAK